MLSCCNQADDAVAPFYLLDLSGRAEAQKQLYDDIPRLVTEYGDAVGVADLYGSLSVTTMLRPAHIDNAFTLQLSITPIWK